MKSVLCITCVAILSGCSQSTPESTPTVDDTAHDSGHDHRDFAPAYSPDGKHIAFYSYREEGDNGDIYLLDRVNGAVRQLTSDSTFDIEPRWAPDGSEIAYTVSPDMRSLQTAFIDLDGNPTRDRIDGGIATWSGDGQTIAVNRRGDTGFVPEFVRLRDGFRRSVPGRIGVGFLGPWTSDLGSVLYVRAPDEDTVAKDLYLLLIEESNSRQLTTGVDVQFRNWSRDMARICVVGAKDGQTDVFVATIDGEELRQVTHSPEAEFMCSWSPDGSRIAYAREDGEAIRLYEVEVATGEETRLVDVQ